MLELFVIARKNIRKGLKHLLSVKSARIIHRRKNIRNRIKHLLGVKTARNIRRRKKEHSKRFETFTERENC